MSFKLSWKSQVNCIVIVGIIVLIMHSTVDVILSNFISQSFILYPTKNLLVNFYIYIIFLMVPISLAHEGIHGAVYRILGGRVKFGFKGIYAYTMEVSGIPIQRIQFLMVLMSPLMVISILSVLLPAWFGGIIFLLNLLGASGDIYMALFLCKFNFNCKIIDRTYGFDVRE